MALLGLAFIYFLTNPLGPGTFLWIRIPALFIFFILIARFYIHFFQKKGAYYLSLLTLAFLFLGAEIYLQFRPFSSGAGDSLISKAWYNQYWTPVNSLGYRDAEPKNENKKRNILLIGDSFTAGQGIEDPGDRMSKYLEKLWNEKYQVWNAGECGAGAEKEFENLKSFPLKPDLIIWQWFINDVEATAGLLGVKYVHPATSPFKKMLRFPARFSYVFDFFTTVLLSVEGKGYTEYLSKIYSDEKIVQAHMQVLQKAKTWADENAIPIYFVLAPLPSQLEISQKLLSVIEVKLKESGMEGINLTACSNKTLLKNRIVNLFDHHPGEDLQKAWAIEISKRIQFMPE